MKIIRSALLVAFGLLLVAGPTAASAKTFNNVVGGVGDASATAECPEGQYLAGVKVRMGSWWDQMAIVCAPILSDATFGEQTVGTPYGGEGGNAPVVRACNNTEVVTGAYVMLTKNNRQVDRVILHCSSTSTWEVRGVRVFAPGWNGGGDQVEQKCPNGEVATGFNVRFGKHVGALGLICDTYKLSNVAVATAPASSPPETSYADQRAYEIQVTGKSVGECQTSNQMCEARLKASLGTVNSLGPIATDCTPYLQQCLANAAASEKQYADQRAYETQVTGRSAAECQQSNQACEARIRATYGPINALGVIASQCTPYLQQCVVNAAAAEAAAADSDTGMADASSDASTGVEPANKARVKKGVNVHLGNAKGEVLGSLEPGTTVEYFECDKSTCRIPFQGDEGFVARSFLDLDVGDDAAGGGFKVEIPLPGKDNKIVIASVPSATSFAGVWDSKTDKNWSYVISLSQKGNKVSGGYVAQDGSKGTINGTVADSTLSFKWTADGGYVGSGSFAMTSDGVMDGSYDTTVYPDPKMDDYYKKGSWHAERR